MVREFAEFQGFTGKVEVTEQSLREGLSLAEADPGYARILLARQPLPDKSSAIVGMALYFHNYSSWCGKPGIFLEDLYVRPHYRNHGYGKMLMQELAQEVLRIGGGRLDWTCLRRNQRSLEFYSSLGAEMRQDRVQFRLDGESLQTLANSM